MQCPFLMRRYGRSRPSTGKACAGRAGTVIYTCRIANREKYRCATLLARRSDPDPDGVTSDAGKPNFKQGNQRGWNHDASDQPLLISIGIASTSRNR